ncbi:hypothetical protein BDZ97DRAFT_1835933 [Flammula alnicola]|nr:hypothetical protein BDZ97DRAFT_1835933 [Flammula alnicola]
MVIMHYGDDKLHEHVGHLQRNQAKFPHNRNPLPLAAKNDNNRRNALRNVQSAGRHPGLHSPTFNERQACGSAEPSETLQGVRVGAILVVWVSRANVQGISRGGPGETYIIIRRCII